MTQSRPEHGFVLHEKDALGLLQAVLDVLCDDATISLEGDLSPIAPLLDAIPGTLPEPTTALSRQAIGRSSLGFVIIPVNWDTLDMIKNTILPAAGLGKSIVHVQVAKGTQWQFGAYDLDHWGPGMHASFVTGDAISETTLKQFASRRLIRGYDPWQSYDRKTADN